MTKWSVIFLSIITLIAAIIGCIFRFSYTDITADGEPMLSMSVAMWLDEINPDHMNFLEEQLPDSSYILRVQGTGEIEYKFHQNLQHVKVIAVYKGADLKPNADIYITIGSDYFILDEMQANCGFVNHCQAGREYLVFLNERILTPQREPYPVFAFEGYIIEPMFCYDDIENTVIPVNIDHIIAPYAKVKANEFFVGDQASLEHWLELKDHLLSLYPKDN